MKKNIWIINQYTGTPKYGMNYRNYYIAEEFVKNGHDVTVFSGSYSHLLTSYPETDGLFTEEMIDGVRFIWVKLPEYNKSKSMGRILNMLLFMLKLFRFKISRQKKPDVIIVSSLSLFPILNGYVWSKLLKCKLIFEVRDIWPLTLIELGGVSKYHPLVILLGWFEKLGYKKAEYVVSVLPNALAHMRTKGLESSKFRYIPNGVRLAEVEASEPLDAAVAAKIPKDKFIVGYVGTIGIANALIFLMQAAEKIKEYDDIHFVIVGKGGEQEALEEFCRSHSMTNVSFVGYIPKLQVQSALQHFDVCYLGANNHKIYDYGISANKMFDYMYSTKPMLYTIGLPDSVNIVNLSGCGICAEAENVEQIKDAVLKLYHMSPEERQSMGNKGKEYVINKHTYEKLAKEYLELI